MKAIDESRVDARVELRILSYLDQWSSKGCNKYSRVHSDYCQA